MNGALACIAAFALVYRCARSRLGHGLGALLLVGYAYGILRARIHDSSVHFMFDAAVVALYAERYGHWTAEAVERSRRVMPWLVMLVGWPTLLMLIPQRHILIQLVGLRAAIFFMPFVAIGARVDREDLDALAEWIAALNIIAFGFAVAEYWKGIEPFFPRNSVTEIMYMSTDVGQHQHRIPATFSSSHAYGGTMVATLPFLLTRWQARGAATKTALFSAAIVLTTLGIFIAGPRLPAGILFIELVVIGATVRIPTRLKTGVAAFGAVVAYVVSQSDRFQRFKLLGDTEKVVDRVGWSVNMTFVEMLFQYPFGAGLASATGTSIPYFLRDLVHEPQIGLENEFGRIALEQSLIGLTIWIAFIWNTILQRPAPVSAEWEIGTRMMRIYVAVSWAAAFIGTGMLTSIPQTPILLLVMGLLWRAPPRPLARRRLAAAARPAADTLAPGP